jgi:hypothetical protein
MMGFHPSVSYRPIPSLVALFTRGASCTGNPRAPHSRSCAATSFSYTDVVKSSMEHRNFNGNDNRGGNACGLVA